MEATMERPTRDAVPETAGRVLVCYGEGIENDDTLAGAVFVRRPGRVVVKSSVTADTGLDIKGIELVYAYLTLEDMQLLADSIRRRHGIIGRS